MAVCSTDKRCYQYLRGENMSHRTAENRRTQSPFLLASVSPSLAWKCGPCRQETTDYSPQCFQKLLVVL